MVALKDALTCIQSTITGKGMLVGPKRAFRKNSTKRESARPNLNSSGSRKIVAEHGLFSSSEDFAPCQSLTKAVLES